jgi:hypothetical protein
MSNSYRIIKLKSGDDVITKIKGRENGKLIVETPMIFKSTIVTDFTGIPKEVTVLQKWAKYSKNKEIKIPEDFILTYLTPMDDAIRLYNLEKDREQKESSLKKEMPRMTNEVIKKLLDDIIDFKSNNESDSAVFKFIGNNKEIEDLFDKFEIDINFINDSFFDEEMEISFEEINEDEYTGNDTNHPDYGNRWTDWDSDLSDYFEKD